MPPGLQGDPKAKSVQLHQGYQMRTQRSRRGGKSENLAGFAKHWEFAQAPSILESAFSDEFPVAQLPNEKAYHKSRHAEKCHKRVQGALPEVLRRASECMQPVFGVEVKEVDHSYALVRKLDLTYDERLRYEKGMSKTSLDDCPRPDIYKRQLNQWGDNLGRAENKGYVLWEEVLHLWESQEDHHQRSDAWKVPGLPADAP